MVLPFMRFLPVKGFWSREKVCGVGDGDRNGDENGSGDGDGDEDGSGMEMEMRMRVPIFASYYAFVIVSLT